MRKNKIIQVTTVWHFSLPASLYLHKSSIFSFSHSRCLFISFSSKHKAGGVTSRFFLSMTVATIWTWLKVMLQKLLQYFQ